MALDLMRLEDITPDQVVFWRLGPLELNATIAFTWGVMALLVLGSWLATRNLSTGRRISRWQNLLEVLVGYVRAQVRDVVQAAQIGRAHV